MAELALRTTELRVQKAKYLAWRPVGSAIVCQSDHTIRRKWLEICCDLVSPTKRDNYRNLPGWQRLCDAWTKELREAWLEADRPTKDWPLSQLLEDHSFSAKLWDSLILPIGVDKDLPLAPESDVPVHRTWLWSEIERKKYFIVAHTDSDSPMVDGWNGHDQRDAETGAVLPPLAEGETRDPRINMVICPRKMVKYETDLALSGTLLAKIADPTVTVHPDFAAPVPVAKIVQPPLAAQVEGKV